MNEHECTFDAVQRAIANAGVSGPHDSEMLAHVLLDSVDDSLGEVRARLIASGTAPDVVDRAVKAGIFARVSAGLGFKLEAMRQVPGSQPRDLNA